MFPILLLLFIFFTQCIFTSLYGSTFLTYLKNPNLNLTIIHLDVNTLHSRIKHNILLGELSINLKLYYIDTMNNTLNDRLNEIFLQYQGGLQNNCLNHILHLNNGETDDSSALLVIPNSSYYDIENFNSLVNNSVNCFGIFSINIQSINAKFQELEAFVEELHSLKFYFSLICI